MTNHELQTAIDTMFKNCLLSYHTTESHKESLKQYKELLSIQLDRAKKIDTPIKRHTYED